MATETRGRRRNFDQADLNRCLANTEFWKQTFGPAYLTRAENGDCFEVHGKAILHRSETGMLCHGTVEHPKVGRHWHCWIEKQMELPAPVGVVTLDVCLDISNGRDIELPLVVYYAAGSVADVKRYAPDEAVAMMVERGTFGPWHTVEGVVR